MLLSDSIPFLTSVRAENFVAFGERKFSMYVLEVMGGPLDGKTWTFDREITIGRDDAVAGACITIDRYISRKHARLYDADGELRVVDLASRNGTKIAGALLEGEAPLPEGGVFLVGRTALRVKRT